MSNTIYAPMHTPSMAGSILPVFVVPCLQVPAPNPVSGVRVASRSGHGTWCLAGRIGRWIKFRSRYAHSGGESFQDYYCYL